MPVIKNSGYKAPFWAVGGHMQTILPALFRNVNFKYQKRFEITTPDGDFLEIDESTQNAGKLVILCHGLEGNSQAPYMLGMAKFFYKNGFDALAWNCRSCGSKINDAKCMYHSGISSDLRIVVNHALSLNKYKTIVLAGFSMGGNIILKYLGEEGENINKSIKAAATFSVPVDLAASGKKLEKPLNKVYLARFLKTLKQKVKQKQAQFPGIFSNIKKLNSVNNFYGFDDMFTAPLHGFLSADDYYEKSSSKHFLNKIHIPALLVNALNDPFLPEECFPYKDAEKNAYLYLETPKNGGHVGFPNNNFKGEFWHEKRALEFVKSHI